MAKDFYHKNVFQALEKDGWRITHDPYPLNVDDVGYEIDFGAERLIFVDRGVEKIAIEVKSFLNPSAMTDFHTAMGQFLTYRLAIKREQPERTLYLAVPKGPYDMLFQSDFIQLAIEEYSLLLIVYDHAEEVITRWIS